MAVSAADATLCLLAGASALLLRFEFSPPTDIREIAWKLLLVWLAVKVIVFRFCHVHRFSWRHMSVPDLRRMLAANLLASTMAALVAYLAIGRFPRSLPPLDLVLSVAYLTGARLLVRMSSELVESGESARARRTRVFIYGAGRAGVMLLREIRQNAALAYEVTGFIDDSPGLHGDYIHGVRVLGPGAKLQQLANQYPVELVLIAVENGSVSQMSAILGRCSDAGLRCRVLPGISAVVGGRALSNQLRDLSVEDLLGREPVVLDQKALAGVLLGKTVMVTGAAGSIGSELCRQIARHQPKLIVGLDAAETPLFFLDREMKQGVHNVQFQPVIGSVQDRERLAEVMQEYRPSIVFHAAAYKHVPMMEGNPYEAVANNIFGTESVLRVAMAAGVGAFVMVSTDKAVRPTNVMGTTKRIAELLVNALSSEKMKCVSVRFGNVLGSNGSVIPIFKQQIAAGGPVTVTHPEMRRYFMTIPEAAQLVLQSAVVGKSGEIMVLEMGDPVKIVDLANNLIRLAGLRPGVDIQVQFSGIRPGEKLYEEINLDDESIIPTTHRKINVFAGPVWDRLTMEEELARIRAAWKQRDTALLLRLMQETVPEYQVNRKLLRQKPGEVAVGGDGLMRFSAILLGTIDRSVSARLLSATPQSVTVASENPIPLDSALKVEHGPDILLTEVSSCSREDDHFVVTLRVTHRLSPEETAAR